jgi:hypothetical protein
MITEHAPKTPSPRTGIFALLGGLLRAKGTTTPKITKVTTTSAPTPIQPRPAHGHQPSNSNPTETSKSQKSTAASSQTDIKQHALLRSLILGCLVSLTFATPALAGKQYISGPSFGEKGSGAGQLEDPEGIAVNNDATSPSLADVYVADTGNRRVDVFTSSGTFVMAFGKNVGGLGEDTCMVTCVAGESGSAPGAFEAPRYIAVDQATGDLYVADTGDNLISKFSESGALVQSWGNNGPGGTPNGHLNGSPAELFKELGGVTVGPAGEVWVLSKSSEVTEFTAAEFSDTGVFEKAFSTGAFIPALAVDSTGAVYVSGNQAEKYESGIKVSEFSQFPSAFAINPATNNVLAFQSERQAQHSNDIQLYPPFAEPPAPIETFTSEGLSPSNGIAVSGAAAAGYPVYVTQPASDTVATFDYAQLPHVVSEPASSVEIEQQAGHPSVVATLNGTVDPNELPVTKCEFEYGTSTAYGHSVPCEQSLEAISKGTDGKGDETVPVTAKLANLLPSTTYHFRIRAANQNDETEQPNPGLDEEFPTPGPTIVSEAPASEVTGSVATLSGELNPGGLPLSKCEFEYGTKAEFTATGLYQHSVPCEPGAAAIGEGTAPVPVHAALTNLVGGTAYSFRLVATTEVFATKQQVTVTGGGLELTTLTTPVVAGGEAVNVTSSGAELKASVNPEGLQVTHCAFEYGTSTAYEESEPCAPSLKEIGHGSGFVAVSSTIGELRPNTLYHWRLSVRDKNGEAFAVDHTFIYPTTTTAELPDHRAYEMVTPPFKNGALVGSIFGGFEYANSADGSRVLAISIQCFAAEETCTATRHTQGEPFEFTRTSSGWVTTPLAPPQQAKENTLWLASAEAGTALFSAPTGPGSEDNWYLRSSEGAFADIGPVTRPGLTGIVPFKNVQRQATADLSHVVWEQEVTSSTGGSFWPFDATTGSYSVYEYAGTGNKEPFLVGVTGTSASTELVSTCGTHLGGSAGAIGTTRGDLSADGRTVYFTAYDYKNQATEREEPCPGGSGVNAHTPVPVNELYARVDGELPDAHTVAISQPEAPQTLSSTPADENCTSEECQKDIGETTNWRDATFQDASADGSKVFFTDTQQLTDQATQGTGSALDGLCATTGSDCNLYLYDFGWPAGHNLIDVSAGVGGAPVPGGPRVQGVVATSADGSHVYFVAQGTLTGASNSQGQVPRGGADNLYVFDTETRHIAFVATLAPSDQTDDWESSGGVGALFPNVTPDGRFLVFPSFAALTPDDTRTAEPYRGPEFYEGQQIFRYDAATEQLVRISVGNEGYNDDGNAGVGNAAIVPVDAYVVEAGLPREDPTMSDDGSYVFFMSPLALTTHALNDVVIGEEIPTGSTVLSPIYAQNVYEWHEGHVYLISDGHDTSVAKSPCPEDEPTLGSASCLLGSDATASNVFFTTTDRLVGKDTDTQVDIYDARICEPEHGNPCVTEPQPPLPPCGGEQCHGIPEPTPSLLAPGTATFNGEGNTPSSPPPPVKPAVKKKTVKCKSGFVKNKKNKCVRRKKAKAKKSAKGRK